RGGGTPPQPLERGVEVADDFVRDRHARIRIDGVDVDREQRDLADPRLVLDLDDVVAEPDDQIGGPQELTLYLTAGPLDASESERMILGDHALGHRGRREGEPGGPHYRLGAAR